MHQPDEDDTATYYRRLVEAQNGIAANYQFWADLVDSCATIFTPDDDIRAHGLGITLDGSHKYKL